METLSVITVSDLNLSMGYSKNNMDDGRKENFSRMYTESSSELIESHLYSLHYTKFWHVMYRNSFSETMKTS